MVEPVDRFEAEQQRRVAVVLEDRGRGERRFEAVDDAVAHDAAKAAQRLAALLEVVGSPRSQRCTALRLRRDRISRVSAGVKRCSGLTYFGRGHVG